MYRCPKVLRTQGHLQDGALVEGCMDAVVDMVGVVVVGGEVVLVVEILVVLVVVDVVVGGLVVELVTMTESHSM